MTTATLDRLKACIDSAAEWHLHCAIQLKIVASHLRDSPIMQEVADLHAQLELALADGNFINDASEEGFDPFVEAREFSFDEKWGGELCGTGQGWINGFFKDPSWLILLEEPSRDIDHFVDQYGGLIKSVTRMLRQRIAEYDRNAAAAMGFEVVEDEDAAISRAQYKADLIEAARLAWGGDGNAIVLALAESREDHPDGWLAGALEVPARAATDTTGEADHGH